MNVQQRIELLEKLGKYILSDNPDWMAVKERAARENNWFTPEFIDLSSNQIALHFLHATALQKVAASYTFKSEPKNVGIIMAGNIPLVGFHDWLCVFLSGHNAKIKLSSKDPFLLKHLVGKIIEWAPELDTATTFSEMLKGCDAYIATGSNNSSRYFEQYFGKYPHIIRKNRTSVAILSGKETKEALEALADDVHLYFGLGCRNVTKLYVPENYDFVPLLNAFRKYNYLADHHKYKNNYDYQLAVLIINHKFYMTNDSVLLYEDNAVFAPISQVHYEFYKDVASVEQFLEKHESIQCIVGENHVPFGNAQQPCLTDFADDVDTLKFLQEL